jgi:hypothetical protein
MNFNFIKLLWALALFSKAFPLGLASGTAGFIAKEDQEIQAKALQYKKESIEKIRKELLKIPCNNEKERCFNHLLNINSRFGNLKNDRTS